jgi:hypothetical protein
MRLPFETARGWGRDRAWDHEAPDLIGARGDRSIPEDDALATERGRRGASQQQQQQQQEEAAAASERTATVRPNRSWARRGEHETLTPRRPTAPRPRGRGRGGGGGEKGGGAGQGRAGQAEQRALGTKQRAGVVMHKYSHAPPPLRISRASAARWIYPPAPAQDDTAQAHPPPVAHAGEGSRVTSSPPSRQPATLLPFYSCAPPRPETDGARSPRVVKELPLLARAAQRGGAESARPASRSRIDRRENHRLLPPVRWVSDTDAEES